MATVKLVPMSAPLTLLNTSAVLMGSSLKTVPKIGFKSGSALPVSAVV